MAKLPNLTASDQAHIKVMSAIAQSVADTPMILKGGTALLLAYGLTRFSEDLDFDSTKPIQLHSRIKQALKQHASIEALDILKNTATVCRYRLKYETPSGPGKLKIETSFREIPDHYKYTFINGIQVYELPAIIDQKLKALIGRTTARDLYDINFLATEHAQHFDAKQIEQLAYFTKDLNALESRFKKAFIDDALLFESDVEELLISLQTRSHDLGKYSIHLDDINKPENINNKASINNDDPYINPDTGAFKNKLNIKDNDTLDQVSLKFAKARLEQGLPKGNFDYAHFKAIHKHIFQDLYTWAGEERTVNIAKRNTQFAMVEYIKPSFNKQAERLKNDNYLRGLNKADFCERAAYHFIEVNMIHPFREGNGRTTRAFFNQLALDAGYELHWEKVSPETYLRASIEGDWDYKPMEAIFEQITAPLEKEKQQAITQEEVSKEEIDKDSELDFDI